LDGAGLRLSQNYGESQASAAQRSLRLDGRANADVVTQQRWRQAVFELSKSARVDLDRTQARQLSQEAGQEEFCTGIGIAFRWPFCMLAMSRKTVLPNGRPEPLLHSVHCNPRSFTARILSVTTPQLVTVTGVDDGVKDGDIAYTIITAASSSADPVYHGIDPADVAVLNLDNETAPELIFEDGFETP
jgi:hypothetical protein